MEKVCTSCKFGLKKGQKSVRACSFNYCVMNTLLSVSPTLSSIFRPNTKLANDSNGKYNCHKATGRAAKLCTRPVDCFEPERGKKRDQVGNNSITFWPLTLAALEQHS